MMINPYYKAARTTITILIVFMLLYVFLRLGRRYMRRELNRLGVPTCLTCGYDLCGIEGACCPECGAMYSPPPVLSVQSMRLDSVSEMWAYVFRPPWNVPELSALDTAEARRGVVRRMLRRPPAVFFWPIAAIAGMSAGTLGVALHEAAFGSDEIIAHLGVPDILVFGLPLAIATVQIIARAFRPVFRNRLRRELGCTDQ